MRLSVCFVWSELFGAVTRHSNRAGRKQFDLLFGNTDVTECIARFIGRSGTCLSRNSVAAGVDRGTAEANVTEMTLAFRAPRV